MAYEPHVWGPGPEDITNEKMNRIEQGIAHTQSLGGDWVMLYMENNVPYIVPSNSKQYILCDTYEIGGHELSVETVKDGQNHDITRIQGLKDAYYMVAMFGSGYTEYPQGTSIQTALSYASWIRIKDSRSSGRVKEMHSSISWARNSSTIGRDMIKRSYNGNYLYKAEGEQYLEFTFDTYSLPSDVYQHIGSPFVIMVEKIAST